MSVHEAAAAMQGLLPAAGGDVYFAGIAVDSRRIEGGELFFALQGEHSDGHRYLAAARDAGAVAAVVSDAQAAKKHWSGACGPLPHVLVSDTFAALHDLTRAARQLAPQHLIGITGSAGKTTTKEILALLMARKYRCSPSPGNLNNLYGFPVSLLSIPADTEWMVAEMGMSTPGELGGVSELARPDVAVFTNVRAAHLEAFDLPAGRAATVRDIARAKAELLQGLRPDGLVIANGDDPETRWIAEQHLARGGFCLQFRLSTEPTGEKCPLEVSQLELDSGGSRFQLQLNSAALSDLPAHLSSVTESTGMRQRVAVRLPLHGLVNVENFLAAATCAVALGVSLSEIAAATSELEPVAGRGRVMSLGRDLTVVDDTYNSNPSALSAAMQAARQLHGRRHVAVLGEMRELGRSSPQLHEEAGRQAVALGFDHVIAVGELARPLVAAVRAAGGEVEWVAERAAAERLVCTLVKRGDVVLIKGSRGVGLEHVVSALEAHWSQQGQDPGEVC